MVSSIRSANCDTGPLGRDLAQRMLSARDHLGNRDTNEGVEVARNLCVACPVREACAREALRVPQPFDRVGIVAGTLPRERKGVRFELPVTPETGGAWGGGPDQHAAEADHRIAFRHDDARR